MSHTDSPEGGSMDERYDLQALIAERFPTYAQVRRERVLTPHAKKGEQGADPSH